MRASLPMYARPELDRAHRDMWRCVQTALTEHGLPAPNLSAPQNLMAHWIRPDLVFSQTCGRPFVQGLHTEVALLGTPDYGLPDCPPGYYNSAVIARTSDPRNHLSDFDGACLAYNEKTSQSGYYAAKTLGLSFSKEIQSDAHRKSASFVAAGDADIATIDAVTWAHMKTYDDLSALRVLAFTAPVPGLPFICSSTMDRPRLRHALVQALETCPKDTMRALRLRGIVDIPARTYFDELGPS